MINEMNFFLLLRYKNDNTTTEKVAVKKKKRRTKSFESNEKEEIKEMKARLFLNR